MEGQRVDKCGAQFPEDVDLRVEQEKEWVSRGAYKLLRAFQVFPLSVKGLRCLDIGASTGGFTEVLLAQGASRVYAVDVGYGQLSWKLRTSPQVVVMERTNARYLTPGDFDGPPQFCCMDASFISLTCILPRIDEILPPPGEAVILVKPQFEAGRERLGKGGVVSDPRVHGEVLQEAGTFIKEHTSFTVCGLDYSPLRGPKGNIEFLFHLGRDAENNSLSPEKIAQVVEEAHAMEEQLP